MKLDILKESHIKQATSIIDEQGTPKDSVWNQYYVVVDGKEYPFKHLVRTAYKLATDETLNFQSNELYRDYVENTLGYEVRFYNGGYNFFTKEELDFYVSICNQDYRKDNPNQSYYATKLYPIIQKLKYWLEQIRPEDFLIRNDGKWLGVNSKVSPYLWPRLYKGDDKDIFYNVEVLTKAASAEILQLYIDKGWYQEMLSDLYNINLDADQLDKCIQENPSVLFNVKFTANQLNHIPTELIPIDEDNDILSNRYTLMNVSQTVQNKYDELEKTGFSFDDSGSLDIDLAKSGKRKSRSKEIELELKHNLIQQRFLSYLQKKYGKEKVKSECKAHGASRIDIVQKTDTGFIFYEIKTYNNLKTSIRESIGQLLEYCLYPNVQEAKKLVLVSHVKPSDELISYFTMH